MTKDNTVSIIKTGLVVFAIVASIVTSALLGGVRIGKTEQAVIEARNESKAIAAQQLLQKQMLDSIRTEQAYQKGVVNTKLDNLQTTIEQIMEIISKWEPQDASP